MSSSHHYLSLGARNAFRYLLISALTLMALLALVEAPHGLAAWQPHFLFSRAFSPMPLGNYANTAVQLGANTTITPSAAPTATTSINVSTSTNFKGKLEGNPTTGVVRVTDAHPAGTYTVTVTAFDGGPSTKTFTLTVTTPATCSTVAFAAAVNFGTGSAPASVAVGDFNGDGKQDLVTANSNAANVSVLLGNGAGSFSPTTNFSVGIGPRSVAVGDFNGDGNQDLATANGTANNVSVLLGNGVGIFSAAINFGAGANPFFVAVGDFNADGKQDLAIANQNSNNVSVLLGSGAGGFAAATNFGVGTNPRAVTVGDFNGDGKQDLATANQTSSNVSVLIGNGAGGFGPATNFVAGANPVSVAMGDFNGDGNQDLTVANLEANVTILLGNGTGSFSAPASFGANPTAVEVGDFNNDGKQDVAAANFSSGNVSVLLGNGAGSLSAATNFGVGTNPFAITSGDFNSDGSRDLAVANFGSGNVSVLLRQCVVLPTLAISDVSVAEGNSGTVNAVFTVTLSAASAQPVTVNYFTVDGTATGGFDYQTFTNGLIFNPGETSKTLSVVVIGDTLNEVNETFSLNLADAMNATIADSQGIGTIANDDPVPNLTITDVSQAEGNSGTTSLNFTVNLSAASGQTVTVNYATANGTAASASDYQAIGLTALTFTPSQTSKTVTVLVNGDTANEPNETFFINLSSATNSNITDNQGQGTILNDDAPTLSITDVSVIEGNSGTVNAVLTVSLSAVSGQTVTVNYATADGTATAGGDYQAIGATTLTFNPGEISKPVTVSVVGDTLNEANETFFINLSSPTNAAIADSQGVGTILNDDLPPTGSLKISGRAVDDSGRSIGGIIIILSGAGSGGTTTDGNGNYSFANLVAGGNYTVTPSSSSYSFSPANQTFNNLNVDRIANFVGTQTIVNITGQVTDSNNAGVNNVGVVLTKDGLAVGTVQTDGLGNYGFGNLAAGANYVVTPAGSFAPSSQTFSNLASNAVANFKAAPSIPPQCNTVSFGRTDFAAGPLLPASVALGDFNGDGKSDLAVGNGSIDNTVSIFLGTGTGSFGAATNVAAGSAPASVAIGDFNGDGKSDLAVANNGSANVSILLGTGTGSFGAATNSAVGSDPLSVALGDFNGDGKSDLAVANASSNNVSILLGTGTGSFGAATNFAVGSGPRSVAIGDFNGDDKSDLAVANSGSTNVSILLGTGMGSFGAATSFAVSSGPRSVAIGDFNGDGKLDLAVVNAGSDNISILLGTGTGSFSAATNFAVGSNPQSVAVGDFNGDGKSDLAVAAGGSVSILLGTGTGSFGRTDFTTGSDYISIAIGDFNGDGKSDLAVAGFFTQNVSILLNNSATCNTQSSLTISGRTANATGNPLPEVTVTLSGPVTRVVQTDINGNYSFPNLVPGGNYSVTVQSPYFVFAPSRADFLNLGSNQTANFMAAPVAVPAPSPPLIDDFTSTVRDPTKWNLGTQTQSAAAVDPQVATAQVNGELVITPVNQASGKHYNGYVAANSFDLRNGKASVEVVKAASGGADTAFAVGSDSENFFRFLVHTAGAPLNLLSDKGFDSLKEMPDTTTTTTAQLIFQVEVNGQLTSLSIDYDLIQHKFMRFRHEPPAIAPTDGAVVFETSPNNIDFAVQRRILLEKGVSPMTAELSAGTSSPTNSGTAVFDNFSLTTSTFQFSSGGYSVGEGDGSVLITVTRSGTVNDTASVDYATVDGTAQQGSKYVNATGKLTFAAGQTSKTFSVLILDNDLAEGNKTVNLMLGNPVSAGFNSPGRAVLNIVDNDTLAPIWQPVMLTAGQAEIKTWISGGRTYAYLKLLFPNAGYRVIDWGAPARAGNDFTADAAVEKFTGASVQSVTTTAQIYDLGPLANGTYNFNFKTSGTLAKTLQFTVSSTVPPPNPIDTAREFVKQQYRDFLNREADQGGENFWTDNITKCSDPARRPAGQTVEQCTLRQRETTSGAFFLSPEFQYTGYFVYRMYQGALGRQPKLSEFIPDAQFVGNGIVVNGQLSGAVINQNKAAFAALFVNCTDATKYRCAEFKSIYDGLNNQQYVDKLFQTTGVNSNASDQNRVDLVNGLNGGMETRATVVQKVVDGINVRGEGDQDFTTPYGQAFYNSELNRAFVQLEYFGYMKRDPDDAGYAFWLNKLNTAGGNFVNAEMVLAFISSPEYRARFGQP